MKAEDKIPGKTKFKGRRRERETHTYKNGVARDVTGVLDKVV